MSRDRLTMRIAAAEKAAEKKRDTGNKGELKRNLDGFDYDSSKAAILKKALHNINVSLGTMISAMKDLSILRGSEITPDGMLGGRGFIMPFRDIKLKLNTAITELSDVTDSIADELTNPKWGLSTSDRKKVKQEVQEIEEEVQEVEELVPGAVPTDTKTSDPVVTDTSVDKPDLDTINPDDIRDSFEIEALRRYGDLINGNSKDKVASVLGKRIMANLSKGAK